MSNIAIVVQREVSVRVRKKAFIITTIITPLLFALMTMLPSLLMRLDVDAEYALGVVDRSGKVVDSLTNKGGVTIAPLSATLAQTDFQAIIAEDKLDAILLIEPDSLGDPSKFVVFSEKTPTVEVMGKVERQLERVIRSYKLVGYNIPGLREIVADVNQDISLTSVAWDEEGNTQESNAGLSSVFGILLGMVIFMLIMITSQAVMNAVVEEKTTRIVEVLLSSVRPYELMLGKIFGVALVVIIQVLIWGVLTAVLVPIFSMLFSLSLPEALPAMAEGVQVPEVDPDSVQGILGALFGFDFFSILGWSFLFALFGYLLYASMFAAVGAAVDEPADAAQLVTPVMMPLMIAMMIMILIPKAPEGQLSLWASIIPFTSPLVLPVRMVYGAPLWLPIVSLVVLILSFAGMVWLAGKVYAKGILKFGKKGSWKEILSWIKG